jgi:hypothetical protein
MLSRTQPTDAKTLLSRGKDPQHPADDRVTHHLSPPSYSKQDNRQPPASRVCTVVIGASSRMSRSNLWSTPSMSISPRGSLTSFSALHWVRYHVSEAVGLTWSSVLDLCDCQREGGEQLHLDNHLSRSDCRRKCSIDLSKSNYVSVNYALQV